MKQSYTLTFIYLIYKTFALSKQADFEMSVW